MRARGSGWRRCRTLHTGLSRELTMVATLPQLEYPRDWPAWTRIVGPLLWEPPGRRGRPPPGDEPLVLVAPSTSQDPAHTLLRAALDGLARRAGAGARDCERAAEPERRSRCPPTRVLVQWLSYARTMPRLRPGGLPRRARDAGAGAGARLPGGGRARRRAT